MRLMNKSTLDELRNIHIDDVDFDELFCLRERISAKLSKRKIKYLDANDVEEIFCWKLDTQAHRSKMLRSNNVDSIVVPITKAYFTIEHHNFECETELKVKLISLLKGVGTPLASAFMAITEPHKYCVIDSVLWKNIYQEDKSSFNTKDYLQLHKLIFDISKKLKMDIQSTEFRIWKLYNKSK